MKTIGMLLAAGAAICVYGYGDLPATFDASTGYVTMTASDTGSLQSFFIAGNWSSGNPPERGTNYYVAANRTFATPLTAAMVEEQKLVDADCQTFKGDKLVVAGTFWHLNGDYPFTIPDMYMLPGSLIQYTAPKTPLAGMLTVYGTQASPSRVHFAMNATKALSLDFAIKGDVGSCLATSWSTASDMKPSTLRLHGDLSGYFGTLRVGATDLSAGTANVGLSLSSEHLGGTIELPIDHACLFLESANGLTAGGLRVTHSNTRLFIDGLKLNASTARLTITNSLEITDSSYVMFQGVSYSATLGNPPSFPNFAEPTDPGEVKVIRLTPEAVANGGWTHARLSGKFVPPVSPALERSELFWRDDPDGGKTLWLVTCVMHTAMSDVQSRSSLTFSTKIADGTDYYWNNETNPADDLDSLGKCYMSRNTIYTPTTGSAFYTFPGKTLFLTDTSLYVFNASFGFICDELVLRNGEIRMASTGVSDSSRRDENGNAYKVWKVRGGIRMTGSNTLTCYGTREMIRVEAEVEGDGDIKATTINNSSSYLNDAGVHEFAALNTNFLGKVKVTAVDNTTKYADLGIVVPNWQQHVRLFVSDERNLGGARDTFAWDALYIDQYSELVPLNDVAFTDGWNRGVAIGNIGRMNVTNGLTLAIRRPLNVNGNLVKDGGGTLALGGTLTFGGSAQSATPTAGANLLTVMGGFVKPLATNAFDGLAITFTNNAALKLDGMSADAGLLKYGLVDTKETTAPIALAPNQATLPVTVDFGAAAEPPAVQWTVGLVTLETAKAEALKPQMALSNPAPFKNWRGTLGLVANGNGTSTVVVNYKTAGMMILFR